MNTAELILYSFPDPVYAATSLAVFTALGIEARAIAPEETTQTVGYLARFPGQSPTPRPLLLPQLTEPMMVLCGLSRPRMETLFSAMRTAGTPAPNRKAVLTPTNMGWSVAALYEELGREHEAMHQGSK